MSFGVWVVEGSGLLWEKVSGLVVDPVFNLLLYLLYNHLNTMSYLAFALDSKL